MTPVVRIVVRLLAMGVMAWAAGAGTAQAALVLEGTRIVFPGDAKDVSIRARNSGDVPLLLQAWLDDGRSDESPETLVVPFLVSPAVSRIEPGSSAVLRVFYTRRALPADRESVFYLNALETPPSSGKDNAVGLRFRTRIKLFFRPSGLAGRIEDAPASLSWAAADGGAALEVRNPTPYFVSFLSVELAGGDGRRRTAMGGGMVAPFSTERFRLPAGARAARGANAAVHYTVINDFGGAQEFERALESR
ncbi:MAG: fimbria/pilus periplasmic chaperone [Achromobacter sp.]|uniref:fimbria/pilus periplasmic chaperone n=1 Tax=Achromobacter sp. TaxID=134375 RepID=UPI003D013570